jgi:hypothetical protein
MGGLLTEGSFLQPQRPVYREGLFGQRYVIRKGKPVYENDIQVRVLGYRFAVKGYYDLGTPASSIIGLTDAERLLQDWYPLVRDMAKKTLKYKHTPTTLTDYDMLSYILEAYHYLVANMTTLLNLSRMGMYSVGFSVLTPYLPRYMSRLTRLWRRTSALRVPPLLKAHALLSGMIVETPGFHSPIVRFWSTAGLLASGSGGPTLTDIDDTYPNILQDNTKLGDFVANLEIVQRWLEVGTAAISDDFTAVKDLIDMTQDIVPGSFETGLPEHASLPGLTVSPAVTQELIFRCIGIKHEESVGTDQWGAYPVWDDDYYGTGRLPIMSLVDNPVYDQTLLGSVKAIAWDDQSVKYNDVNSDVRLIGTDVPLPAHGALASGNAIYFFGGDSLAHEIYLSGTSGSESSQYRAKDFDSITFLTYVLGADPVATRNPWFVPLLCHVQSPAALPWCRLATEEGGGPNVTYIDREDLCSNYAEVWGKALGIPYR